MIISIIGFFFMGITGLIKVIDKSSDKNNRWYYLLFTFISEILISLEDVICKILLIDKFLLPQNLMFFRGIVFSVILIILIPILQSTDQIQLDNYFNFVINNAVYICLKILLIIFSFFKSFITMKVIYIFSPQHVAFCNATFYLYLLILCRCQNDKNVLIIIIDIFSLIVIIFANLVFNELLIINVFEFNQNTKKGFIKKEMLELQNINSLENHEDEEDSEENEENSDSKRETLNENDNRQSTINGNIGDFDGSTNASINNTEMSINDINDNNNKDIN
jgi:hypothetical protein